MVKLNKKFLIIVVALCFLGLGAAGAMAQSSSALNLPEPVKNLIDSFKGADILGGIKSAFSAINKFFVEKFNLSIEKVFKAILDLIIWIFAKFIELLEWIRRAV